MKYLKSMAIAWLSSTSMAIAFPTAMMAQGADAQLEAQKQKMAEQALQLSLDQLPPIQKDIYGDDGQIVVRAGTAPEDFLTPFDMGWEHLTINDIQRLTGQDVASLPVSSFPGLHEYLSQESNRKNKRNQFALLLKPWKLLESPAYAQTAPPPSAVVPINSLPGVGNVQIQTISGPLGNPNPAAAASAGSSASGASAPISVYPALASVPILSTILSVKDYFVPMDLVLAGGEHFDSPCDKGIECKEAPTIDNAASGVWKKPFIPCTPGKAKGDDCAHIEVRRNGSEDMQVHIRWMTKLQKETEGDFICTKGPVGRHPFGPNPRVVIEDLKENGNHKSVWPYPKGDKKAEAEFALYFYVKGPFGLKSANCFGPIPLPVFGNVSEGGLVLFGLDSGKPNAIVSSLISGVQNPGAAPAGGGGASQPNLPVPVDCQGTQSSYMRPSSGVVTSEFGDRVHPITGAVSFHSGIDLGGGYGTPILASNCGVVISAGVNGGYGNDVCIKHSPTMTTCYSHLDEILVATGQTVKKGQIIGKEGSTGFSTGPHLHFMVLVNGSPQNPRNYVPI